MSLRLRIIVLIGAVLLVSTGLGSLVAGLHAKRVLRDELSAALGGGVQTVTRAYEDLPKSDHQGRDLNLLIAAFDGDRHVRAALRNAEGAWIRASRGRVPAAAPPLWFRKALGRSSAPVELRVPDGVRGFSAVVLRPMADVDVADVWQEFCRVIGVLAATAFLGLLAVYIVLGLALKPLRALSAQFDRLGAGDFTGRAKVEGPPELVSLQQGFNRMSRQLFTVTARNRDLTDQLSTMQDEERADIARDIHDEIGPYLFSAAISSDMLLKLHHAGEHSAVPEKVRLIQASVGHMQRQVADLLRRLQPVRSIEFGLNAAIRDLAAFWARRPPDVAFELNLLRDEEAISDAFRDAIYDVVQETTIVSMQSGNPKAIQIEVDLQNETDLVAMVFDDDDQPRRQEAQDIGLFGVGERLSALGGSLLSARTAGGGGWSVVARLPLDRQVASPRLLELEG